MDNNNIKMELTYRIPNFKYLDEFYNVGYEIYAFALNSKKDLTIQQASNDIEKLLLGNKTIVNSLDTKDTISSLENISKNIVISKCKNIGTNITFKNINCNCTIIQKKARGYQNIIENVIVNDETNFNVKDPFFIYANEHFSIALRSKDFGIAVSFKESQSGLKGDYVTIIKYYNNDYLYIDDLSKYIDTSILSKFNLI